MFLRKSLSNGKVYLSFVQGYRDENGKVKQKTVQKIGYLDNLKQKYDDPISHFKEIAKQRNNEEIKEYTIKNFNSKSINNESISKNLGYVILEKVYDELNISNILNKMQNTLNIKYSLNDIMRLLVFSRILYPASKNETYNNKNIFFEKFDFSLKDLYRSLDYFQSLKDDIIKSIWENTKDTYNRDTSITYYDTTNYYFEMMKI